MITVYQEIQVEKSAVLVFSFTELKSHVIEYEKIISCITISKSSELEWIMLSCNVSNKQYYSCSFIPKERTIS
jgi:hypothetical protein